MTPVTAHAYSDTLDSFARDLAAVPEPAGLAASAHPPGVVVLTLDYPRSMRLSGLLPTGWRVTHEASATSPALVVLGRPSPEAVSATRSRWPDALVLAVLPAPGDAAQVIALLQGGAHGCTRGDSPALVSAHLGALLRWRKLGRFPHPAH